MTDLPLARASSMSCSRLSGVFQVASLQMTLPSSSLGSYATCLRVWSRPIHPIA